MLSGTNTLNLNTNYFIVISSSSSSAGGKMYFTTTSIGEDEGGAEGLAIQNESRYRVKTSTTWNTNSAQILLQINGGKIVPELWIGNFNNTYRDFPDIFFIKDYSFAQGFTTGPDEAGYLVTSIDVVFYATFTQPINGQVFAQLYEAGSDGAPGEPVKA